MHISNRLGTMLVIYFILNMMFFIFCYTRLWNKIKQLIPQPRVYEKIMVYLMIFIIFIGIENTLMESVYYVLGLIGME